MAMLLVSLIPTSENGLYFHPKLPSAEEDGQRSNRFPPVPESR